MKITLTRNIKLPHKNPFEVVERKGIGHPDTVADALAEKISVEYSKYCLKHFGAVLHHNVDKTAVLGGLVRVDWGNGQMLKPIRVLIDGRISASFGSKKIPVKAICEKAIKLQLSNSLPSLDTKRWLRIIDESTTYSKNPRWFRPLSLSDVPDHANRFANDTSAVVSYWPLSKTEQAALLLEGYFYGRGGRPRFKEFGQDIKVMIVRKEEKFNITLCVPFFAKHISSGEKYWKMLSGLESDLLCYAKSFLGDKARIDLKVNPHDQRRKGQKSANSFYFVASGGALDYGEEGVVGRGNNRLGVIPSFRPYTMEAACGKNPVYHVGKVLGLLADTLAKRISETFDCHSEVWIITRNADPLFEPNNIIVNVSKGIPARRLKEVAREILNKRDWTKKIIYKEALVPTSFGFPDKRNFCY